MWRNFFNSMLNSMAHARLGDRSASGLGAKAADRRYHRGKALIVERTLYESDHEAYRETVREFLAREVVPYQEDWDREHWIDREVFARAAKAGIYALQIGEE